MRWGFVCAVFWSLLPLVAGASPPPEESRTLHVLKPAAASHIVEAFRQAGPTWRLENAQIDKSVVVGQVCLGDGNARCFPFRLSHLDDGCQASEAGPWCVAVEGAAGLSAELPRLIDALSKTPPEVWSDVTSGVPAERKMLSTAGLRVALSLLAYLCLPLLLGLLAGRVVGRSRRRWPLWLRVAGGLSLVVGAVCSLRLVPLGVWDLALVGSIAAVAFVWRSASSWQLNGRGLALGGLILLCGLGGIEWLVRKRLPEPPKYPAATEAQLRFRPESIEVSCRALGIEGEPPWPNRWAGGAIREGERVLHLGDSMVQGVGVEGSEAFPAVLESLDPGVAHINAGARSGGVDSYLMVLRRWIDHTKPTRVVVHLFTGNDVYDMDKPYSCSDAQSFFEYPPGEPPRQRCQTPRWRFTLSMLVGEAPSPYPLRVLSSLSWSARHAITGFNTFSTRLGLRFQEKTQREHEQSYAHIELVLKAMRDDLRARNVPLIVSVLPFREALESAQPRAAMEWQVRGRFVEIAARLGLLVLDPWDDFERLTKQEGSRRIFITPPDWEIHFNQEGHRYYAQWLLQHLGPGLRTAPAAGALTETGP